MAKVFTITEGLENLGALRTGGQGSVYKGRRIGEIFTAVKLLPTPIYSESADDKNFQSFQNEVLKLKKVNEEPNPNVVKILNSGLTESGSFPFIEMEFIEGPDLEELLKSPHDPVFSVREVIKVADQLANAIAHCHRVGVKHGDIKSNNVKFNIHTANYVLLDFGLAVMSDEQRRTSLRHAGAIEFMAPEQNEGKMLFQTDVYSFGIILYELLAGLVPFPLKDSGETNRNAVMLSHMEAAVPDLMSLRRNNLPSRWVPEKREMEMQVPDWLLAVINKCLQKRPEDRFENGIVLHEAIVRNSTLAGEGNSLVSGANAEVLQKEMAVLQSQLLHSQQSNAQKDQEIARLKSLAAADAEELVEERNSGVNMSKGTLVALILLIAGLGAFATYSLFSRGKSSETVIPSVVEEDSTAAVDTLPRKLERAPAAVAEPVDTIPDTTQVQQDDFDPEMSPEPLPAEQQPADQTEADNSSAATNGNESAVEDINKKKKYVLNVNKAYFYDEPSPGTRRNAFLVIWNNAELTALDEQNNFIYVEFFNTQGQITKGWLRKKDLKRIK